MHAMPRKSFRKTATALLAIPSATSGVRSARSPSPFPASMSMTLPALTPHTVPPSSSCRSSPGNPNDTDCSIVDFQPLPNAAPDIHPEPAPSPSAPAAAERQDWRQMLRSKQHYALVRKTIGFLHDNRALSSKHPNTARRLRQINAELRADTSHRLLKRVLNAVFIVIGLLLLLSVLAAIGYTSTGQCDTVTPFTGPAFQSSLPRFVQFRQYVLYVSRGVGLGSKTHLKYSLKPPLWHYPEAQK